jgi:hypothetical protein
MDRKQEAFYLPVEQTVMVSNFSRHIAAKRFFQPLFSKTDKHS